MKVWVFKDTKDEILWQTSVEKFAEEYTQLLEEKGIKYVISIQES